MSTPPILLPHPSSRVRLIDDWISSLIDGNLGWTNQNAGTGAAPTLTDTVVDNNHWGILQLQTGTTATGRSGVNLALNASTFSIKFNASIGSSEWLIQFPTLSTAGERYTFRIGTGDIFTADINNGSYFEYDESIATTWRAKTASGGTRTVVDSGVTVVAGAWIKLRIDRTATDRKYYINNILVATISTNIPTTSTYPMVTINKSAGTTTRLAYVDYFLMDYIFNTAR